MWQAEVRVDLDAIRDNVRTAARRHHRRGDGGGQGRRVRPRHAAGRPGGARRGGATWLGVCTLDEALELRRAGITAPVLAWLLAPGLPLHEAVAAEVDLGAASLAQLDEVVAAARPRRAARPACTSRSTPGCPAAAPPPADWPALLRGRREGAGRRRWSRSSACGATSSTPTCPATRPSTASSPSSARGWPWPSGPGISPRYRHIANSAATLTRPDTHFDLVRPGIAVYGLSPGRRARRSGCGRR